MLTAFNKPEPIDYIERGAKFDMKKFFNGDIDAFAIVQDENGKITDTKTVKITGRWEENKGVIQQNFILADGKKDSRTWLITVNDDGTFEAVGHDVSAMATGRQISGSAQMNYGLFLNGQNGREEIKFEDRMYMANENSVIMISTMKKGYSPAGKIIMSLSKAPAPSKDAAKGASN
jgi:hypothetical protein